MRILNAIYFLYLLILPPCDSMETLDLGMPNKNCSMHTIKNDVRDKLSLLLEAGKKIIFIHLSFPDQPDPFVDKYDANMYKPLRWVRTTSRHGRSLLFLRPQFEELSLTTLSFETASMDVALTQSRKDCLVHLNATLIEEKIRDLLLSDFKAEAHDGSLSENEHICNIHIFNDNSYARFFYRCCHRDPDGNVICQDMNKDFWIDVVFACIFGINILALMFSPHLIPSKFYKQKYERKEYEHKLKRNMLLCVKKISKDETRKMKKENCNIFPIKKVDGKKKFFKIASDKLIEGQRTELLLDKISIHVPRRRLVPANNVPVGILKAFYSMIIKCNIRKIEPYERCCNASLISNRFENKTNLDVEQGTINTYSAEIVKYPWFRYLQYFMKFLMLVVVSVPWIIRILFFLMFERPHSNEERQAAEIHNMTFPIQWNLTNSLSPIHALFLCCYAILCFDALAIGITSDEVKRNLQTLMRKCIRDMQGTKRSKVFQWAVLMFLLPCEKIGIFGILLFGIYILFVTPVVLVVFAFYCLPTANLVLQIVAHFFLPLTKPCLKRLQIIHLKRYFHLDLLLEDDCRDNNNDQTSNSARNVPNSQDDQAEIVVGNTVFHFIVLLACLLTIFSFALLAMEIIVFLIEVFVYSIIGIIMNASSMLKYISLIFMLGLYARDCFNGVSEKYLQFNKALNRLVLDMMRVEVESVARASAADQRPTAFQVETYTEESTENVWCTNLKTARVYAENGVLKLQIPKLILFLDEDDMPYLTEKFFRETCEIKTVCVPGPLIRNLLKASWRFFCICIFLMFVVLVVLAFGDEFQISGTNQMLATLAGGFLPWVFRNVLFKSKDALTIDDKNINFKMKLQEQIENYQQTWDISDIELTPVEDTSLCFKQENISSNILEGGEISNEKQKLIPDFYIQILDCKEG